MLLRRRGVSGATNSIFEFYGEGVATIPVTGRTSICNMSTETGATTAIFPSDDRTREWLEAQQRPTHFLELKADEGAEYDEYEHIALDELEPLIAQPHSPGNVVPVSEVAGTKAYQVCIGSSVNSGFEDLAIAAAVLRDKSVHQDLVMTVTPGSRQILNSIAGTGVYGARVKAGARMPEPICGPCVGMGYAPPSDAVSVRTFNRNFPGRSGTPSDQVYLTTPTVAAATALYGVITDPRELGEYPDLPEAPMYPAVDDAQILAPAPEDEADKIEVPRGPNIHEPPGGENYGQGSSREHAALAPLHLGVRAVIAKGFARIHRRNLIAQGIMPLLFKNEEDYDKFEQGQEVTLPDIREHLQNGDTEVTAQMNGTEITLLAQFSERERNMLIDGGFRRQLRQGQEEEAPEGGQFKRQSEPPSERDAEQGGEMS